MASRPSGGVQRLKGLRGVLVALSGWGVLTTLALSGAFETFDLKLLDLRYRIRGERPASDDIALVEIDDATIAAYGGAWPLERSTYALLLNAIEEAGARAVGFDLLFLGSDQVDSLKSDQVLAYVTSRHSNIVHAIVFPPEGVPSAGGTKPSTAQLEILARHGLPATIAVPGEASLISLPRDVVFDAASALGHVNVLVDRDGAIRRWPPVIPYQGRLYPSLTLRLAAVALGEESIPPISRSHGALVIRLAAGKERRLPLDGEGGTSILFAGDRRVFRNSRSLLDVLQAYAAGDTAGLRASFHNRIVLVGNTAVGQAVPDQGPTPFSSATPLVYVHANALNSLLRNQFVVRAGPAPVAIVLALLSALLGWLFVVLPLPVAAGIMAASVASAAGIDYALFALYGLDVPPALPLVLFPVIYAAIASYRFVFLERVEQAREKELQVARDIQRRLLPAARPDVPEFDVFGENRPAQEVGGDFFDWIRMGGDGLVVALADVSGKGVSAALLMSHLRASLHAEAREGIPPREIIRSLHNSLFSATEQNRFATFFLALLSRNGGDLLYCNAGHNPGFLAHNGSVEELGATGLPLGMFETGGHAESSRRFDPGDVLVLYSDGITECPFKSEMYGEDRLSRLVGTLAAQPLTAEQIGHAILDDVRRWAHGDPGADDVTVVVVRRL